MTGARYSVEYDPRAIKELSKLDRSIARRVRSAIEDAAPLVLVVRVGHRGDLYDRL